MKDGKTNGVPFELVLLGDLKQVEPPERRVAVEVRVRVRVDGCWCWCWDVGTRVCQCSYKAGDKGRLKLEIFEERIGNAR